MKNEPWLTKLNNSVRNGMETAGWMFRCVMPGMVYNVICRSLIVRLPPGWHHRSACLHLLRTDLKMHCYRTVHSELKTARTANCRHTCWVQQKHAATTLPAAALSIVFEMHWTGIPPTANQPSCPLTCLQHLWRMPRNVRHEIINLYTIKQESLNSFVMIQSHI